MPHLDTKKPTNFWETGNPANGIGHAATAAGYQVLLFCSYDHLRVACMGMLPDEKKEVTALFLRRALLFFESRGVRAKKLLADNSKAERPIQALLKEWAYDPTWQGSD